MNSVARETTEEPYTPGFANTLFGGTSTLVCFKGFIVGVVLGISMSLVWHICKCTWKTMGRYLVERRHHRQHPVQGPQRPFITYEALLRLTAV